MNTIFGNVDLSQVPSGILFDYGLNLADDSLYNGTLVDDNILSPQVWKSLYADLWSSQINPAPLDLHHHFSKRLVKISMLRSVASFTRTSERFLTTNSCYRDFPDQNRHASLMLPEASYVYRKGTVESNSTPGGRTFGTP
jgi:hypothetical protein